MSDEPPAAPLPSEPFASMAERINRNTSDFAGAFVIVPPEGAPLEMLLLNNTRDQAAFWALVQSTAQRAIAELSQPKQGWGQR